MSGKEIRNISVQMYWWDTQGRHEFPLSSDKGYFFQYFQDAPVSGMLQISISQWNVFPLYLAVAFFIS